MGVSGGGLGFDEGGVLQALSRPFRSKVTETFKYGRAGSAHAGLVVEHVTVTDEVSMSTIVSAAILGGLLIYGDEISEEIKNSPELALGIFGLSGIVASVIIREWKEGSPETGLGFWDSLFGWKGV